MPIKILTTIIIVYFTFIAPCLGRETQHTEETEYTEETKQIKETKTLKEALKSQDQYYPVALVIENDVLNKTDAGYTNGFTLSISSPWTREDQASKANFIYHLTDRFSIVKQDHRKRRITFALIHEIYTPWDLKNEKRIDDDLPYSGILYGQLLVDYQNKNRADAFGLILGMIGPAAQGEWLQKGGHKMVGVPAPEGWNNQIDDELLINLNYTHKWMTSSTPLKSSGLGFDMIPYAGASLGNLLTDAKFGIMARIGNHSPASPSTIYKGRLGSLPDIGYKPVPFTGFLMAGLEGAYTFYSVLLDGNSFKPSQKVTRKPDSASFYAGVGMGWEKFRMGLFWIRETKRFEEQKKAYSYASITLGWLF